MKNRIITISREFGSAGRTIGKKVAEMLGIPCYDQEIIEKVAEESGFAHDYISEHGEYATQSSWIGNIFSMRANNTMSNQDILWVAQSNTVKELAQKGACVIVGRCADYILRDDFPLLKVFVHADMSVRADRIVRLYGERADSPEKRLKEKDKQRSAYYRYYTDMEWGKAQNYHLSLDSGVLGIDNCVDTVVRLYKALD